MAYRKKFEDSYLDEEPEEFDGKNLSDAQKVVLLIQKAEHSERDVAFIKKLTNRLELGAQMPGPMGTEALEGLQLIAEAYAAEEMDTEATETWARLVEVAQLVGNKELYYYANDKMTGVA